MRKFKRLMATVLVSAVSCTMLAGCGANQTPTNLTSVAEGASGATGISDASMYPGTLGEGAVTINIMSEPPDLFSLTMTDTTSITVIRHVMENLVTLDENDQVMPGVATDWTTSDDGLVYTFNLREGMKWSNGDPVTAHDFVFACTSLLSPELGSEYAYFGYVLKNGEAYNTGKASREDVGVKALSDYVFEVTLEAPASYAVSMFAYPVLAPVNERAYTEFGSSYGTDADKLVTNGAFTMTSWEHDSKIILTKNPDFYRADEVEIEELTMVMLNDTNTDLNAFKAGEVDMVNNLRGEQADMMAAEGYPVQHYDDGSCFYLTFNMKEGEILANKNLRKALTYALDKQAYVDVVMGNSSKAATSFTPAALNGYKDKFVNEVGELQPVLDVEKAQEYYAKALEELGIDSVSLSMICDDTDAAMDTAAFVQEQFKQNLGLDLQIESMPFKSRLERMTNKDFDIVFAGWSPDYNDPMTFLDMFETGGGNNHSSYSNTEYDALLESVRNELDPKTRFNYLKEVEALLLEDQPIGPVYWRNRDYIVSGKIASGVVRTAFQDINLKYAKLAK